MVSVHRRRRSTARRSRDLQHADGIGTALQSVVTASQYGEFLDRIRWSVDLRWQRPGEKSGMEGIKSPILMRTASDPGYQINWSEWAKHSRHPSEGALDKAVEMKDEFNAMVTGPWMDRWAAV